jgi:beta-glucosidase
VEGDEVAEFYLTPSASPATPVRRLVGFSRVHLAPEQERTVTLTLTAENAKTVVEDGSKVLLPGTYTLFCGGAQPAEAKSSVEGSFQVK